MIPFDDTKQALAIGLVDCAIGSIVSANSAEWTKYASYYFPLAFGFGINGYVLSMTKWNKLSVNQQLIFQKAITTYLEKHWRYSEKIYYNSRYCQSQKICPEKKLIPLIESLPSNNDIVLLRTIAQSTIQQKWAEKCELVHDGCIRQWEKVITPILKGTSKNQQDT